MEQRQLLLECAEREDFHWALELLFDLLAVETTPRPDLDALRNAETQAFDRIEQAITETLGRSGSILRVPINPEIQLHPAYTPPFYTAPSPGGVPLPAAGAYRGRANLVVSVAGRGRGVLAFNSHVDTVAPHLAPRSEGEVVFGRGACDAKGQCVAMLGALRLLRKLHHHAAAIPPCDLLFQFVIDEEPGGNGSLSLALDPRFGFDAMVVLEPTGLSVHPGNRGAVWFKLVSDTTRVPAINPIALVLEVALALEEAGSALKAESDHPLFPHRPVQTCHGVLGPWGKHPSAVNDHVELFIRPHGERGEAVEAIARGVAAFCHRHGDKRQETDPATGSRRVERHFELRDEEGGLRLIVHGIAGHMGAAERCDNAITKAAFIARELGAASCLGQLGFEPGQEPAVVTLEGGQGFLPTHSIEEVMERMRRAAREAVVRHCRRRGLAPAHALVRMTFEKLYNDAFARDANGRAVVALVEAARAVGIEVEEPLRGWDVSCDARLFAKEHPESEVLTFGAGSLEHAHSPDEQIAFGEIAQAVKALAAFALAYEPERRGDHG